MSLGEWTHDLNGHMAWSQLTKHNPFPFQATSERRVKGRLYTNGVKVFQHCRLHWCTWIKGFLFLLWAYRYIWFTCPLKCRSSVKPARCYGLSFRYCVTLLILLLRVSRLLWEPLSARTVRATTKRCNTWESLSQRPLPVCCAGPRHLNTQTTTLAQATKLRKLSPYASSQSLRREPQCPKIACT